jgi:hypothetical protein
VQAAAACDTLKGCPATTAVAERAVVVVFAATANVTDPEPTRPVPFWNVRKGLAVVAPQAQPVWVVTVTLPFIPVARAATVAGVIEKLQGTTASGTVN